MTVIRKFSSLKGSKFIGINGYINSKNEVANYVLNVNIDVEKAKKRDLETLRTFEPMILKDIASNLNCDISIVETALQELIQAEIKNANSETASNQSIAQQDAYLNIGKGLSIHKDTETLYVYGFVQSKNVLVAGEYPTVNSRPKTLAKNAIKKHLRMSKFRRMKVGSASALKVSGDTITVSR